MGLRCLRLHAPVTAPAIALPLYRRHVFSINTYLLVHLTLPSTAYNRRLVYFLLRFSFNYPPLHARCRRYRRRRSIRAGHDAAAQQHVELGRREQRP